MTSMSGYVDDSLADLGYGSLVDAVLEHVPDLRHPQSIETFGKMRRDPQLAGALRVYSRPITRASVFLDGAGCRDEVVQLVADDLGLPVKGADETPNGARRRKVSYRKHLRLSLLDLPFGHMAFEQQLEPVAGRMRLMKLVERMPQTIAEIKTNSDGDLIEVTQKERGVGQSAAPKMRPPTLVWYANEREGSNWFGQSLLRESFPLWLMKNEIFRVHGTSIRRFGMGIPTAQALPGTSPTPAEIGAAQRVVGMYRASEHAGIAMPPGFRLALEGMTGNVPDALAFIEYCDRMMTRNTLTSILDMAASARGNRSLGETVMDLLVLSQQSIADEHALAATEQIIVPLVDANWGEDEPAPQISFSDVGADYELTAQDLNLLLQYGGLTHDDKLEGWVRQRYNLPEIDLATRPVAVTSTPTAPAPDVPAPDVAAPTRVAAAATTSSTPTGVAVLLMLSATDADRLAVDGGEAADSMHVTLGYLADPASDYDTATRASLTAALAQTWTKPVPADAFATAVLNPDSDERDPASVLLVQSTELADLHDAVTAAIGDLASTTFPTWVPHVTIAYNANTDVTEGKTGPLTFDRLVLAWAGEQITVGGASPTVAAAARGAVPQTVTLRRDATPIEAAAQTDFEQHQHDWQDALDILVASWASITRSQRQQLAEQVKAAVESGRIDALADLAVDTAAGAEKLAEAMISVAGTAADRQVLEAAAQGVQILPGVADADALRARAALTASQLGNGFSQAAVRRATQVWTPQVDPSTVAGSVMDYLTGLGDGPLRARLGGALSSAQSAGRLSSIDLSILAGNGPSTFVASEILDDATCDNCAGVDGTYFDSFDDAQLAYGSGGYSDCLGGDSCRGTVISLWNAGELAPAA